MEKEMIRIGIDVGSTTVKIVALDSMNKILFSHYSRHLSDIFYKAAEILKMVYEKLSPFLNEEEKAWLKNETREIVK